MAALPSDNASCFVDNSAAHDLESPLVLVTGADSLTTTAHELTSSKKTTAVLGKLKGQGEERSSLKRKLPSETSRLGSESGDYPLYGRPLLMLVPSRSPRLCDYFCFFFSQPLGSWFFGSCFFGSWFFVSSFLSFTSARWEISAKPSVTLCNYSQEESCKALLHHRHSRKIFLMLLSRCQ